ncbi:MAG: hypothetical protein LR005_02475 [Candidatus Pacebacteria bacterium]|nr:hypothetical protein [Candidatus Paceibacterota bacterium]
MKKIHLKIAKLLDKSVSIFLLIASISLILFMVLKVSTEFIDFTNYAVKILSSDVSARGDLMEFFTAKHLHGVTLIILLVKAYKILMSYAEDHHIDIRYIIEIAVIGSVLELLFNSSDYSHVMQVIFLILGLGGALIYHKYYQYDESKE